MSESSPTVTLHVGDVLALLKTFPDNYFDDLFCDPPYGLSFMGQEWDHGVPSKVVWKEASRVLKPGGHLLAFGGTRKWHRLAVNIEDGGFKIRDTMMWLYGCYSEDTQILTPNGWVNGTEIQEGDLVASWCATTDTIRFEVVQKKTLAPYNGPMIHLKNDNTDQLLTPNHRVYVDVCKRKQVNGIRKGHWSGWQVQRADELVPFRRTKLPLGSSQDGQGFGDVKYAALLGWMWTEGGFDHGNNGMGVRLYQSSVNQEHVEEIRQLLYALGITHSEYSRVRTYKDREYTEYTWYWSGDWAERLRLDLPDKKPSWGTIFKMTAEEKAAFFDAAMKGDGSENAFYQKDGECLEKMQTLCHLMGKQARCNFKKRAVSIHHNATTQLQSRHRKAKPPVQYEGMVWCVTVPSGAVMVRRNGRIFISGNSGFPKGHNISKAIAKRKGGALKAREAITYMKARREELGLSRREFEIRIFGRSDGNVRNWEEEISIPKPGLWPKIREAMELESTPYDKDMQRGDREKSVEEGSFGYQKDGERWEKERVIREPVTDLAKLWEGYNTAIKPAWEPLVVAMKSTEGTYASNALKHGVAGLNIDGSRIGFASEDDRDAAKPQGKATSRKAAGDGGLAAGYRETPRGTFEAKQTQGRYPANLILSHHPDCGTEVVETLECHVDCPVRRLDEQTGGEGASRFFYQAKAAKSEREAGLTPPEGKKRANSHPTVKPLDLNRYFANLILPPARESEPRRLLVPFSGVGSEVIGALQAGWDHVEAIEINPEYVSIAQQRIAHHVPEAEVTIEPHEDQNEDQNEDA